MKRTANSAARWVWATLAAVLVAGSGAAQTTQAVVTVTGDLRLTWLWATQHLVSAAAGCGGEVAGDTQAWIDAGTEARLEARPAPFYAFAGWTGLPDGPSTTNPVTFTVDRPLAVTAIFRELLAQQGTPLRWLAGHGLTADDESRDPDADGFLTWQEYVADTDPTNGASYFKPLLMAAKGATLVIRQPETSTNRFYRIDTARDLRAPAWTQQRAEAGNGDELVFELPPTNAHAFFRGRVTVEATNRPPGRLAR